MENFFIHNLCSGMANKNLSILWLRFRFLEQRPQLNSIEILKSRHNKEHLLKLFVTAWNTRVCKNHN